MFEDVNTICRRSWYIAAHIRKFYDFKIEVVPFIINFSTELTTVVRPNDRQTFLLLGHNGNDQITIYNDYR
jgi:hypothetical protein